MSSCYVLYSNTLLRFIKKVFFIYLSIYAFSGDHGAYSADAEGHPGGALRADDHRTRRLDHRASQRAGYRYGSVCVYIGLHMN